MDLGLTDKRAIVLASTAGLGHAVAEALLAEGAKVAISGRDLERFEKALEGFESSYGDRVWGEPLDVTDGDALAGYIDRVREHFDGVDILVINMGGPPQGVASTVTDDELDAAYLLLLKTAVRAVNAVLPAMREQKWGRILGMTSSTVREPIAHLAMSNTMRAGLTGYMKTLATDVAADGVLVNTVCTGMFLTDRLRELAETLAGSGSTAEEALEGLAQTIPVRRIGDPREYGDLAAFLVSERASFITGVAMPIDGGAGKSLL
jgi:3-oxoacyl-[acyl-carrier protein] reductase